MIDNNRKKKIIEILIKHFDKIPPILSNTNKNVFLLLISTVLSQRTKDETTIKISKKLFSKIGNRPSDYIKANIKDIETTIKPSGFYRKKAQAIKEISHILVKKYNSKVPSSLEKLIALPKVGRKTANIVLSLGFNIPAIAVDTHVHRISNRLKIVDTKTPVKTEFELIKIIPKKYWIQINRIFVPFGKNICTSRNPKCKKCILKDICEYKKHYIDK